ncbi:MAG: c-type cytochrome biogenesis protein CcsB [Thermodesulfobacteriota bacterium]|nr:c-type cytochrome biogenesis protein CcsB [Thermodesulfobacteriota bacterium]
MNSSQLLTYCTFTYLLASILYIVVFLFRVHKVGIIATICTVLGFLMQTVGIGLRWVESYEMGFGHAPLTNMYESLVFFSWSIILFYLGLELKFKNRLIGAFATPFAVASMALAALGMPDEIKPLVPALQSNWLIIHVVTCFIGYAALAVACGLGVMYLLKFYIGKPASQPDNQASLIGSLPALKIIDDITYKSIVFGFLWLSAGIITGAIWANSAWGTYWSWDPKETWSLISWFVYAVALHARFVRGWGGRRIAWLAIIGFLAVIFTYFGVNYLLAGLHSYA